MIPVGTTLGSILSTLGQTREDSDVEEDATSPETSLVITANIVDT